MGFRSQGQPVQLYIWRPAGAAPAMCGQGCLAVSWFTAAPALRGQGSSVQGSTSSCRQIGSGSG